MSQRYKVHHVDHRITFHDGYWYCYANSAAMLLSSIGEEVSPHLIEALTGVGLGAIVHEEAPHLPFFSGRAGLPDKGVTQALTLLGFSFEEQVVEDRAAAPFDWLEEALRRSPVVIGPLDMQFLSYNPSRPRKPGVDHYLLVCRLDGDRVFVFDPAGYAEVFLSRAELADAWRAEAIGYKRGYFRSWSHPKRVSNPTPEEIRTEGVAAFKRLYVEAEQLAAERTQPAGDAAIRWLADTIRRGELSPEQSGHLRYFALPLGVKRAWDFARFFELAHPELRWLKQEQAALFGLAHTNLVRDDNAATADHLMRLADIEELIRVAIQER
jgi:hypothetical protein